MIRKALTYLFVTPLLLAASCISENGDCPTKTPEEDAMTLRLKLDMGLDASSGGKESRADGEPDGFYTTIARDFEKISTLRVIILHGNNPRKVEGARLVATDDNGQPTADNLEFEVKSSEIKTILLIANEDALPAPAGSGIDTAREYLDQFMKKGTEISDEQWTQLNSWTVSMPGEYPNATRGIFSTTEAEWPAYGLPLTEIFEVYANPSIPTSAADNSYTQETTLFLSRAAAKARFNFYVDDPDKAPESPFVGRGLYVTGIRLNGIDWEEYVFPKNTDYVPAKYITNSEGIKIPNIEGNSKRYVTNFQPVPNVKKFDFILDTSDKEEAVEIKSYNAEIPMRGPIYFPESMCATTEQNYTVQVRVGTLTNPGEWITAQKEDGALLDNILNVDGLDAIARNTCLDINIFFGEPGITWKASIVPYVGITLKPSFGEILDRNNQN